MVSTDQKTELVPPAEEPDEMPLPSDPKAIFLGGLFVLALLAPPATGRPSFQRAFRGFRSS
jgi:hypothetical protein